MTMSTDTNRLKEVQASLASSDEPKTNLGTTEQNGAAGRQLVVVDSTVEGYESLLDGLDPSAEVLIIGEGGFAELADALSGQSGIQSLQILSHGASGALHLGDDKLDAATISDYAVELAKIGGALTEDGDILLYGCNVGDGSDGMAFLDALAAATGSDVAASDDYTGTATQGGDWDLEVRTGDVEETTAFSALSMAGFNQLLPAPIVGTENFDDGLTLLAQDSAGPAINVSSSGLNATYAGSTSTVDIYIGVPSNAQSNFTDTTFGLSNDWSGQALIFTHAVGSGGTVGSVQDIDYISLSSNDGTNFDLDGFVFFYATDSTSTSFTVSAHDASGTQIGSSVGLTGFTTGTSNSLNVGFVTVTDTDLGSTFDNVDEFRINASDGTSMAMMGIDNVVVGTALANTAPALGGTPADATVTEDVATAIDLSAYNISDADNDSPLTITLAVDRGTIASVDGNGTFDSVIIANSGTTSMTLSGSAADLNTYLNDTSHITFTTDQDDTTSATLTVTPNDGTADGSADTVTISITAVNDAPTATGVPSDLTFLEDMEGSVDMSLIDLEDVDSASVTLTITANEGTFGTPADGASVGGGVTEMRVSDTEITLIGAPDDIDTYLDTASNITWTPASGDTGNDASSFTLTVNDGDGSGDTSLGTINADVTAAGGNSSTIIDFNDGITLLLQDSAGPATDVSSSGFDATYAGDTSTVDVYIGTPSNATGNFTDTTFGLGDDWSGQALIFTNAVGNGGVGGSVQDIDYISLSSNDGTNFDLDGFVFFYAADSATVTFTVTAHDDSGTQIGSAMSLTGFTTGTSNGLNVGYITITDTNDTVLGANFSDIDEFRINSSEGDSMSLMGIDNVVIAEAEAQVCTGQTIDGTSGRDTLLGTDCDDTLSGFGADDNLVGGSGNDILVGGAGSDNIDGGDGDDTFLVDTSDAFNVYSGGNGDDTIRAAEDDTAVMIRSTFDASNSIEAITADGHSGVSIEGTNSSQTLDFSGTTLDNITIIRGNGGNDGITGSAADDTISGGDGYDVLAGGDGDDTFLVGTGELADIFKGGAGNDRVLATEDGLGIGLNGSYSGDQTVELISANGHSGVSIKGTNSSQTLDFSGTTLDGITVIHGNGGNDAITGSSADDTIDGGTGGDRLNGGGGDDALTGGSGSDRFIFDASFGDDVIADFEDGSDLIDLSALSLDFADLTLSEVNGDTVIEYAGDSIVITGVALSSITTADFIL